ncbi:MAG: hypothetical protein NZ929_01305 [Aigarchaeota archaeon]|nr:hypothetical protein [Aigarchaeota archaeon]
MQGFFYNLARNSVVLTVQHHAPSTGIIGTPYGKAEIVVELSR